MHGRYAEGGRSRKNNQGGGRLPIRVNRRPVLAYSECGTAADNKSPNEAGGQVLRRMWEMYDMDFNKMVAMRQRYFRPGYRSKQWTAGYNMRMGRVKKLNRIKRQYEIDWQDWMRREGRRMGLTDPIPYNGPPLKHLVTPEMEEQSEPENVKKMLGSEDEIQNKIIPNLPKGRALVPKDMEPGCWNNDGPDSIFKIWRRPLCKWPWDIGKRGKVGPVVRGIVM